MSAARPLLLGVELKLGVPSWTQQTLLFVTTISAVSWVNTVHFCCKQIHAQSRNGFWLFVTSWTAAHWAPISMRFSGGNTGLGCHFLLQGIFLTRGPKLHLLHLLHWQAGFFFFFNHCTTLEGHVTLYSAKSLPLPASLMTILVQYLPAMWETWVWSPGEGKWLPVPVFWSGEFHVLYSSWGHKNWTGVSDFHFTSLYFTRWTTQMNTA